MTRDEMAHEILRAIRQMVRRISEHSRYLSTEVGLTVPQLMCLKAIGELEDTATGVTVAMVSDAVELSPATVSRIIDRLSRAGLVLRERSSVDRRRVSLSLTAAGLERFQTLPIPLQETFVAKLDQLPARELDQLRVALRRISELMEASQLDAAPILTPGVNVRDESPPGE